MNFPFIKYAARILFVSLLSTIPFHIVADELPEIPALPQVEYLTPDKMNQADYELLNEYSGNYNGCLSDTSIERMNSQPDPRHVVDFAMKHCAGILEELNQKMAEKNFDPNFRQGYIQRVSNRAANSMLRMVMMGMATRQSADEAESQSVPQ